MKTSSSMQDWSGPRLVGVGDGVDQDRSVLALADYPDVGRVKMSPRSCGAPSGASTT